MLTQHRNKKKDKYLEDFAQHPTRLYESRCPFGEHWHIGSADRVLDEVLICLKQWEADQLRKKEAQ